MATELSPTSLADLWAGVSGSLRQAVGVDTFERWFRTVVPVSVDAAELVLRAPNNFFRYWIEDNYLLLLQSAIHIQLGSPRTVRFVYDEEEASAATPPAEPEPVALAAGSAEAEALATEAALPTPVPEEPAPVSGKPSAASSSEGLNPRNTFGSFVVGPTNEYAHAACVRVSESPAKTYNPLFIYGSVGLGKTHLMHAIGHSLKGRKKAKVVYITSECFINEFIDAVQNGTLVKFRRRYREADVLLIDDIQFLAGKERSQEEFFHTFNELHNQHKQIVLSSDRPPNEIQSLETRLVSRFEWGLTAEMAAPELETRLAILRKKAAGLQITIAPDILEFLASRIRTNVRRLEGALMRVASFASLNGNQMPSTEKLEHLLKDLLQEEARRGVTIDQIKTRVAEQFDVRLADMTSKRRPANIAFPRQVAMYFARELTKSSLCEIGEAFGGRDHGTVIHAHRLVKERIKNDEKIRQIVSYLDTQFQK